MSVLSSSSMINGVFTKKTVEGSQGGSDSTRVHQLQQDTLQEKQLQLHGAMDELKETLRLHTAKDHLKSQSERDKLPPEIDNLKTKLVNMTAEIDKLKAQIANMTAETDKLKAQLAESKTKESNEIALHVDQLDKSLVALYNAYIPADKGEEGIKTALRVVEDQISQVGSSYAGSDNLTVFYNTLGQDGVLNSTFMHDLCTVRNNLTCIHMKHYNAFEEVTLQEMHNHCRANEQDSVIYLHSKGSYNSRKGGNDNWRRHLTGAATTEQSSYSTRRHLRCMRSRVWCRTGIHVPREHVCIQVQLCCKTTSSSTIPPLQYNKSLLHLHEESQKHNFTYV
jgi:hypothetical protein